MTPTTHPSGHAPAAAGARHRLLAGALALVTAAWLAGCGGGGGGDTAGVGSGGTGSFSVGTVTGFGSVFVNGIRYEDSGARVVDDDGTVKVVGTDDNPLRLGMVVEVSGSVDDSGTMRKATQIAYGAEIKGPVSAVDAAAGTFDVLGITVRTATTTVYQNFGGVAALASGNVVEVHGQIDSGGRIVATFVEREATSEAAFAAGNGKYRLRGPVAGLSGTAPAYAFTVRGVAIRTDAAARIDGTPAEGVAVGVRLNPTRQADGSYLAERVAVRNASYGSASLAAQGEVEGYVGAFDAASGSFSVASYPARLGSGVAYANGVAADLQDGIRVEAKGSIQSGVLVVSRLEFKSRDDNHDGMDNELAGTSNEFTLMGTATCASCSAGSGSFTIKGVTVAYGASTEFRDGLSGTSLDGKTVEVRCVSEVTAGGTTCRATRIKLDH